MLNSKLVKTKGVSWGLYATFMILYFHYRLPHYYESVTLFSVLCVTLLFSKLILCAWWRGKVGILEPPRWFLLPSCLPVLLMSQAGNHIVRTWLGQVRRRTSKSNSKSPCFHLLNFPLLEKWQIECVCNFAYLYTFSLFFTWIWQCLSCFCFKKYSRAHWIQLWIKHTHIQK